MNDRIPSFVLDQAEHFGGMDACVLRSSVSGLVSPKEISSPRPRPSVYDWQEIDQEKLCSIRVEKMRRSILTTAQLIEQAFPTWVPWFVTLTYRPEARWSARDLKRLIGGLRRWLGEKHVNWKPVYVFKLELTKAGKEHYHLVVWLPKGVRMPFPDKALPGARTPWWLHGMSQVQKVRGRSACPYLAKYLSKEEVRSFKPHARMYGDGGLRGAFRDKKRWNRLPGWLRSQVTYSDRCRPMVGGGWVSATGSRFYSPWEVDVFSGRLLYVRKRTVSEQEEHVEYMEATLHERTTEAYRQRENRAERKARLWSLRQVNDYGF